MVTSPASDAPAARKKKPTTKKAEGGEAVKPKKAATKAPAKGEKATGKAGNPLFIG